MQESTIILTLSKKKHSLAHVETILKALRKIGFSNVDFFSNPSRPKYEIIGAYSDDNIIGTHSDTGGESEEQPTN
jgi:hypothetical protein